MKNLPTIQSIQSKPWLLPMFFLLLVAPFALQYHFFFPDEMYYLDGAIFMQQNHDYLTPTTHSGELRFNKPILSYYLVLLGHKLFGIKAFSSRFFFLLAGALTVLLAYCIGKTISNNKHTASLSAMIAASHPILILSSTRSIPDILLALFVTLSALGVAGLIRFGNKAPTKYLWFFYLGLAFAFEVKGLPAAALGGLAFVFLLVSPAEKISIKKLLHWPSLLITIILAFWWFAVMYSLHGNLFIEGFMEDQVGVRFRTFALRFLSQFVLAVLMMAGFFLPWVLLLITKKKNTKTNESIDRTKKSYSIFVLIWTASILLMSALVTKLYDRYLLPVVPIAAVWFAIQLSGTRFEKRPGMKHIVFFLVLVNSIILLLSLIMLIRLNGSLGAWLTFAASLVLLSLLVYIRNNYELKALQLTGLILLIPFSFTIATSFISFPGYHQQAKKFVELHQPDQGKTIAFIGDQYHGSRIRLGLGKAYRMTTYAKGFSLEDFEKYQYYIGDKQFTSMIPEQGYRIVPMVKTWDRIPANGLFQGLVKGSFSEQFEANAIEYFWIEKTSK